MTDPQQTPTPLAVRDALARGLATAWSDPPLDPDSAWIVWGPQARRAADGLLASGVVRDPVTLPDDDALVDASRSRLQALVSDWQANAGSRPLGDPTADTWNEAARQLLAVLDGKEPTGW